MNQLFTNTTMVRLYNGGTELTRASAASFSTAISPQDSNPYVRPIHKPRLEISIPIQRNEVKMWFLIYTQFTDVTLDVCTANLNHVLDYKVTYKADASVWVDGVRCNPEDIPLSGSNIVFVITCYVAEHILSTYAINKDINPMVTPVTAAPTPDILIHGNFQVVTGDPRVDLLISRTTFKVTSHKRQEGLLKLDTLIRTEDPFGIELGQFFKQRQKIKLVCAKPAQTLVFEVTNVVSVQAVYEAEASLPCIETRLVGIFKTTSGRNLKAAI